VGACQGSQARAKLKGRQAKAPPISIKEAQSLNLSLSLSLDLLFKRGSGALMLQGERRAHPEFKLGEGLGTQG